MEEITRKDNSADPRECFHVIHSGTGGRALSYTYERFPHMLGYLEWILDILDMILEATDPEDYLRQERGAVFYQIEEIRRTGVDTNVEVCKPSWSMNTGLYFRGAVDCAGYWRQFVPAATKVLLQALNSELTSISCQYKSTDDGGSFQRIRNFQNCISTIELLAEREDHSSRIFADDFTTAIQQCIDRCLQHY